MARPIKFIRHCCLISLLAVFVITLRMADGASVANRNEANDEMNAIPDNATIPSAKQGGPTEEKLDSRMMPSSGGYAGHDSVYGASSMPENYASAYSGSGNRYGNAYSSYSSNPSNYAGPPNGAYNTGAAYGAVTQSPFYNSAYGSASYGATPAPYGTGSYAGSAYGSVDSSYPVPSYLPRPTYYGQSYGVAPNYGNNMAPSYGNYGVTYSPHSSYGPSNMQGSYGNYGAGYGAGSYSTGFNGISSSYGVTPSPYSSYGAAPAYGQNSNAYSGAYGGSNSYSNVGAAGYTGNNYPFSYGSNLGY